MKEYKLKINNNSYTVVIKDVTDDAVLAEVNGKQHVVHIDTITNQAPAGINQATSPLSPASSSTTTSPTPSSAPLTGGAGTILTPIPGQIINISVSQGEKVRSGQKLLVLEAMKLENSITASISGTVSDILVAEGDVVNQGQPLIVIT